MIVTKNIKKGTRTIPQLPATKTADTYTILDASSSLFLKQHITIKIIAANIKHKTAIMVLKVLSSVNETVPILAPEGSWVNIYAPIPISAAIATNMRSWIKQLAKHLMIIIITKAKMIAIGNDIRINTQLSIRVVICFVSLPNAEEIASDSVFEVGRQAVLAAK